MTQHRHRDSRGLWTTYSPDPDLSGLATKLALDAAIARIAKLETVQQPVGKTGKADPSFSVLQFMNLCQDSTLDIVELAAGTYRGWRMGSGALTIVRTATKPLTIRPAAGAAVIFDDLNSTNTYGDSPFRMDGSQYVNFDGRPGSFTVQNYLIGQTAIFSLGGVANMNFWNIGVQHCAAGGTSNSQSSHFAYISGGSSHLLFNNITMAHLQPTDMSGVVGVRGGLNGFHMYNHGLPGAASDVQITNCSVSDGDWAVVARDGVTGLVVDNLTVTNCGYGGVPAAIDFGNATGTVKNSHSTNSVGNPILWGNSMVSLGGNVFA